MNQPYSVYKMTDQLVKKPLEVPGEIYHLIEEIVKAYDDKTLISIQIQGPSTTNNMQKAMVIKIKNGG